MIDLKYQPRRPEDAFSGGALWPQAIDHSETSYPLILQPDFRYHQTLSVTITLALNPDGVGEEQCSVMDNSITSRSQKSPCISSATLSGSVPMQRVHGVTHLRRVCLCQQLRLHNHAQLDNSTPPTLRTFRTGQTLRCLHPPPGPRLCRLVPDLNLSRTLLMNYWCICSFTPLIRISKERRCAL